MNNNIQTELQFDRINSKKVIADFTGGTITSDAGLLLIRQLAKGMSIFQQCCSAIQDYRHSSYVEHDVITQLRQPVFQIIAGYFHAKDCDRFRNDPALKAACEHLPLEGNALASQSTMTRLENSVSKTDTYRLALALGRAFTSSYKKTPRKITIDIDDTCDPLHTVHSR